MKFVTDDLVEVDGGLRNEHPHEVRLLKQTALLRPGEVRASSSDLSPDGYLTDASNIDAELVVIYLKRYLAEQNFALPIPDSFLRGLVATVLKGARQVAVEEEQKRRKALKKKKLEKKKECPTIDDEDTII
jgi:hypothetical protein